MLAAGVKLTTNKRTKMGVRESPVRGRAGGCAEAPLAGLPPHGPPSLTQSAAEVAPTGATATRAGSSTCIFVSGRCSLSVYRSGRTLSFAEPVVSMRRNPLRTHRPTVFVDFEANGHPLFVHVDQGGTDLRAQNVRFRRPTLPGKDQPRSRMGFPWFRRGLLRSTRKGFATQACDLFGFACEVTAAAPEHVGACRAGMVPAARREPFNVAQSHARSEPCL